MCFFLMLLYEGIEGVTCPWVDKYWIGGVTRGGLIVSWLSASVTA